MIYWIRQFFTRPETHWSAISEVAVTAILGLAPLLITPLIFNYKNAGSFDFTLGIEQAIGGGQLFLYAYALFGTVVWLAFIRWDREMHGPRRLLGLIAILAALFIVGMLGVDPTISSIQNQSIIKASFWTYGGFLLINYLLLFYLEIEPPAADKSLKSGSQKLKDKYKNMEQS